MLYEGTDASGMEEWRCPVCGRHFIVRWPPDYARLVLAEGDPDATHVGTKGEVGLTGIEVSPPPGEDDWRRWLRDNGIDWDGPAI
jgi:hypothetical protein